MILHELSILQQARSNWEKTTRTLPSWADNSYAFAQLLLWAITLSKRSCAKSFLPWPMYISAKM